MLGPIKRAIVGDAASRDRREGAPSVTVAPTPRRIRRRGRQVAGAARRGHQSQALAAIAAGSVIIASSIGT